MERERVGAYHVALETVSSLLPLAPTFFRFMWGLLAAVGVAISLLHSSAMVHATGSVALRGVWKHNVELLPQHSQTTGREIRFVKSGSGITQAANRAQKLWRNAADTFGAWAHATVYNQRDPQQLRILKERMQSLAVSYIDTYTIVNGQTWVVVDSLPKRITSVAQLIARKIVTDTVGDKIRFSRLAKQVGIEGTIVPRTFESAAEANEAFSGPTASDASSDLVFIKSSISSAGRGVEPVLTKDLPAFLAARGGLKRGELIQEGVDGLALHNGKKFVIRSYFIVHGGALYLSHNALAMLHSKIFNASSALHEIHVDLSHADSIYSDLQGVVGDAANAKWIAAIAAAGKLAGPMFERVVAESATDNLRYHVFGVDVLPKASGAVMLVESNIFPNLERELPAIDRMAVSVLRLLFGVLKGGSDVDEEMTKVWTVPLSSVEIWERERATLGGIL
jgi:hypothetical protein